MQHGLSLPGSWALKIVRRMSYCVNKILEDYLVRDEIKSKRSVPVIIKKQLSYFRIWYQLMHTNLEDCHG
jgi:hypothetical protein